jgi:hypothetical protein
VRSFIAVIMAILGTALTLGGAAALWASGLTKPRTPDMPDASPTRGEKAIDNLGRVPNPDRLIIWGVVLLALSAVAAGAIQISATASTGS